MTARVLVVDDIMANVQLLEAKLTAEYFEVLTAMNGVDACEIAVRSKPDIVLLDVMMPGIDGIETCRRLKQNPATQHIPVIMVTALDQPEDRLASLEAGADDFLTKPVNDISLFSRVRSLSRLKMLTDELRVRAETSGAIGLMLQAEAVAASKGNVLIVDHKEASLERMRNALHEIHNLSLTVDPQKAAEYALTSKQSYELAIISLAAEGFDGLRLVSQLRSHEVTRQLPILVMVDPTDQGNLLRALDMGVNDYLMRPIDRQELVARVSSQIKRWRYTEQLRNSVRASIEMAVTDPLTGLYNRRYLDTHLRHMIIQYSARGKSLSTLAIDADFFKAINDNHGHDAGDAVLIELADRIKQSTRNVDLACRTGGEEFVVVLPGTEIRTASLIAERLRKAVAGKAFAIGGGISLPVTISIGISTLIDAEDKSAAILKRADEALYKAKRNGRNRVETQQILA